MIGQVEHRPEQSRWVFVDDNEQVMGELNYRTNDQSHWHIHHVYVDPSLQGQGIAKRLVDAIDEYCREDGKQLSSSCSYATVVLARKT